MSGLRKLDTKVTVRDLNPKSVSAEELYGCMNLVTREWREGLLSSVMRDLGKVPDEDPKWIMLDGDLDANWIESMNSVMDDNRMLTLANNERIPLRSHMRLLFEIRDLAFATPATVSRAGVIFISTGSGGQWRSLAAAWVRGRLEPDIVKGELSSMFDRYLPPLVEAFAVNRLRALVPVEATTAVRAFLWNMEVLLPYEGQHRDSVNIPVRDLVGARTEIDAPLSEDERNALETLVAYAIVWSFGGALSERDGEDQRVVFSDLLRGLAKSVKFPSRDTVFDYYLEPSNGKLMQWKTSPHFYAVEYHAGTPMSSVTVPTPESAAAMFWLDAMVARGIPAMLVGPAGCGKTAVITGALGLRTGTGGAKGTSGSASAALPPTALCTVNFNFYTSASALQMTLEGPLEKKFATSFGPVGGSALIFFLDDLNLPEVDPYGTQSAIELVRQHLDYGHWFDRTRLTPKFVSGCQYVAAMNPGAGSGLVSPRLQRHFATFAVGFPGPTSLLTIFQTFLDGHLKDYPTEVQAVSSSLLNAALSLHAQVAATFRKTAANFHYEFNLRHIANVFAGILMSESTMVRDPQKLVLLWMHESERVYCDRLVTAEDGAKYRALVQNQCKKRFPQFNVAPYFAAEGAEVLLFCHFGNESTGGGGAAGGASGPKAVSGGGYDQVRDFDSLSTALATALHDYNDGAGAAMDLVLFPDAIRHIARITRAVSSPAGHALVIGVGGSGKRSLSRLAAFVVGLSAVTLSAAAGSSLSDARDELKNMHSRAGVRDEGLVLLIGENLANERVDVLLNDLLAAGCIPDLFTLEERDSIVAACTNKVKLAGLPTEKNSVWAWFMAQVRKNIHVVVCASPAGSELRGRATRFPALVSCTVIDWFHPWPADALALVASRALAPVPDLGDMRDTVERYMPAAFRAVNDEARAYLTSQGRAVYTTPKSFLECLKYFVGMLAAKRAESVGAMTRLDHGLRKLKATSEAVSGIETELKGLLETAEATRDTADTMAAEIARDRTVVERESAAAGIEARTCADIAATVKQRKFETEYDLQRAEPAVAQAMAALDTLTKKDLGECKTMITAPKGVDDVFAACMVLLAGIDPGVPLGKNGKVKDTDRKWESAKKALLNNVGTFLDELRGFKGMVDENAVPPGNWSEVRPYLEIEHFNPGGEWFGCV